MKYAFIRDHREQFDVALMCGLLGVSKSGFYAWLGRDHNGRAAKKLAIVRKIEALHLGSRKVYGSPRIFRALKALGTSVAKATVERLMREFGIKAKTVRRFRATTYSKHSLPIAENIVARVFDRGAPNRVWASDITYLWTDEGWLYLAIVIDCHSRKIVGWAIDKTMTTELVETALNRAIARQNPGPGVIHHSDRGVQYASRSFQSLLKKNGITPSMSRKGNCWDNAVAESFFRSLKVEFVYHERFVTRGEAKSAVFEWIEVFYNRQRLHSGLGYQSPECYERRVGS